MRIINFGIAFLLVTFCTMPHRATGQASSIGQSKIAGELQIRKIKFEGNEHFSDKELKEAISFSGGSWLGKKLFSKESSWFSDDAWQMNVRELRHFYQSEGFIDIVVHEPLLITNPKGTKLKLTIMLSENRPVKIDTVFFAGPDTTLNKQVKEQMVKGSNIFSALPGERFRDEMIWNDRDRIAGFMVNKGFAYAEGRPLIDIDTIAKNADITWETAPGPLSYFGEISITGQERTPERLIRRQLAFSQGELYSREKLNRSQQQVFQLGTFRVASIKAQLSHDMKDSIPVSITLAEAPASTTRAGVGLGREDKFRTFVEFQILNFPGGARRLNIFAKHSALEPYRFDVKLTQPALFSPNSTAVLAASVKKQKESGFELFSYGANLSLTQRITNKLSGTLSLYYEQVDLDTATVATTEEISETPRNYSKGGLSVALLFDNALPKFNPSRGFIIALNTKSNSLILPGNYPFFRYQFELRNYSQLWNPLVIASRLKAGSVYPFPNSGSIPVEERFFAGGSRSVRGWARQQLGPKDESYIPIGGNSIIEASLEPRIALFGSFSMVVFMDAGNVWMSSEGFSLNNLRFAAGGGLRFDTPIGPVGIDLARPVWDEDSRWQFHFNIGHAF